MSSSRALLEILQAAAAYIIQRISARLRALLISLLCSMTEKRPSY